MQKSILYTFCIVVFFLLCDGLALRCRSGNQQADTQYQKVLQICRKRYAGLKTDNGDSLSNESETSSSEENVFDKKFFYRKNDRSYNQSFSNQSNRNRNYPRRGNENNSYSYNRSNFNDGNSRDFQGRLRKTNDRDTWGSRMSSNNYNNYNNRNMRYNNGDGDNDNNNNGREQACVIQCFFNELNVVDQRGLPEKNSVIRLMSQNIQDPELRDFIQESITECFRYLETMNVREKCEYSQNLLNCLAEKGQEKCEDWEN